MLLVCLLVIALVLLFAFSMSREKGKNTKFARKGANPIAQQRETPQSIDTSEVIEIN
jgi:hypothetical protein